MKKPLFISTKKIKGKNIKIIYKYDVQPEIVIKLTIKGWIRKY